MINDQFFAICVLSFIVPAALAHPTPLSITIVPRVSMIAAVDLTNVRAERVHSNRAPRRARRLETRSIALSDDWEEVVRMRTFGHLYVAGKV